MPDQNSFPLERLTGASEGLDTRSVDRFLRPKSVAVIGVSARAGTAGLGVIATLREGGFAGPIYPVSRSPVEIGGITSLTSVDDLPRDVDLRSSLS